MDENMFFFKEGTFCLGTSLILYSVFYIEGLQCDMILLGKLMDENHYVVQMVDWYLVVKDHTLKMVIEAGKREAGTFHFRNMEFAETVTSWSQESNDWWHNRLGDLYAKVVGILLDVSFVISSEIMNKRVTYVSVLSKQALVFHQVQIKQFTFSS